MAKYRVDVSEPAENDLRDIVRYIASQLPAPVSSLHMTELLEEALYNYFTDKESLLVEYFQLVVEDNGKRIKESLLDKTEIKTRLIKLLDLMNEIFSKDVELTTVYFRYRMQKFFEANPLDNPQRSGLENIIFEIIKSAQDNQELRDDIPALLITRNFLISTMNLQIVDICLPGSLPTEQMIATWLTCCLTDPGSD